MRKWLVGGLIALATTSISSAQDIKQQLKVPVQPVPRVSPTIKNAIDRATMERLRLPVPVGVQQYLIYERRGLRVGGPYLAERAIMLTDPRQTDQLIVRPSIPRRDRLSRRIRKLQPSGGYFQGEDGSRAKVLLDSNNRQIGVMRLHSEYASLNLDLDGDRAVDLSVLMEKGRTIAMIGDTARANAGFQLFNPFCSVTQGSADFTSSLLGTEKVNCGTLASPSGSNAFSKPSGERPGTPGYSSANFWGGVCPSLLAANPPRPGERMVANPVINLIEKMIEDLVGDLVEGVLFDDDDRGSGDWFDPSHTGSYPCEYQGTCGSGDAGDVLPPGQGPAQKNPDSAGDQPVDPDTSAEGLLRICEGLAKAHTDWWATNGGRKVATTDCTDPVTMDATEPMALSCLPSADTQAPADRTDEVLGWFRNGCQGSPVTQPGENDTGGKCVADISGSKTKLHFGFGDIVASETGISACPPEICSRGPQR